MTTKLVCKITKKNLNGSDVFECQVELQGAKPTKLTKAKTGETTFGSRSSLTNSAKSFAERYGFEGVEVVDSGKKDNAKTAKTRTKKGKTDSGESRLQLSDSSMNSCN